MAIEKIAVCDGCQRRESMETAKQERWMSLQTHWSSAMDWEVLHATYCCLDCLVQHQTNGKKKIVGV